MLTLEQAMNRLDRFETVDGLARFFKEEGVKGVRCSPYCCPVATWLRKATGNDKINGGRYMFYTGEMRPDGSIESVRSVKVVHDFIAVFDDPTKQNKYKFLRSELA